MEIASVITLPQPASSAIPANSVDVELFYNITPHHGRTEFFGGSDNMEGWVRSRRASVRLTRAEINLSELQKSLDSTALELVENQKENMVGRKKLAEQTRGASLMSTLLCDRS